MPIYMVERVLPGTTRERFTIAQRAAILASTAYCADGVRISYIRSLYMPAEGKWLCLFEAPDEESVRELNVAAALPFVRVTEVMDVPAPLRLVWPPRPDPSAPDPTAPGAPA